MNYTDGIPILVYRVAKQCDVVVCAYERMTELNFYAYL